MNEIKDILIPCAIFVMSLAFSVSMIMFAISELRHAKARRDQIEYERLKRELRNEGRDAEL